ncbi:MAG: ABC1 kinase family protein [Anaerolineae bacterium]
MVYVPLGRRYRHVRRYREIAHILLRHGFGHLVELLELTPFLSLPRRLLRREIAEGPPLTGPEHLRLAVEELGPTFIKMGQILSTRPDLVPPDYLAELERLQDTVPPFPLEAAREQIERELERPVEALFASFSPQPIAAASLGQVHRATLRHGEAVVVKVQRPDIERVIETDLEILFDLARLAQERTPLGETYELVEIVEDFAATLRGELDYRREGRNADRFRRNFANEPTLYIPKVYWEYTTRRVLTLEEIRGVKINDVEGLEAAGLDRHRVALNSTRIILKEVFEDGFFHADPHPGNFFVMEGEVIGAMDFGMVGYLDQRTKESLLRLFLVAVQRDAEGVVDELRRMGVVERRVERWRLERDIQRLLTKYYGLPLKEIRAREVVDDVTPITFRYHLRFPTELWLLAKTLVMMEGVGLQLAPDLDVFAIALPYTQKVLQNMSSPRALAERFLKGATDLADFFLLFPQQWQRLVDQIEGGEFQVVVRSEREEARLTQWSRMANRLSASILIAAFIVALALLITLVSPSLWQGLIFALILLGFLTVGVLALWLLLSLRRPGRR